ncbi:MAG: hypothetical protein JO029_04055 [Candidatus Eremiobacteraeota bacterium]|nr:hypothetical protein [Candidatus Eremiobacteraeota bacterium]MBV8433438.1 hypothetical protein [Candidatus Eremiobacteraeota bacterium]MBV8583194.1 hypothetical protein [Candidatus Eremiobacteraeota bacterium]
MSRQFDRGSIEPSTGEPSSHARVATPYGDISAAIALLDADWKRWMATYLVRIVNGSELLLRATVRGDRSAGATVGSFCVYERTMAIPIPQSGVADAIDVQGCGVSFTVDVPLPDRGPDGRERGTTTGSIRTNP